MRHLALEELFKLRLNNGPWERSLTYKQHLLLLVPLVTICSTEPSLERLQYATKEGLIIALEDVVRRKVAKLYLVFLSKA